MKRLGIERFPAFLLCVVICCYAPFVMLIAVRLRIDLAYDGTDFYGWAKQPDMRTVQEKSNECCIPFFVYRKAMMTSRCA